MLAGNDAVAASPLTTARAPFSKRDWHVNDVRELTMKKLGKRPCWLQIQSALALYSGKDVITCAATGFGKTLTFWIPLLMAMEEGYDKLSIVVTPLNLLGKQNVEILNKAKLSAVAVDGTSMSTKIIQEIGDGKYKVVVINPELLIGNEAVGRLWTVKKFRSKILNFIFDEAHCISQWASFRKQYQYVGNLRYIIDEDIPFYAVSATLPHTILEEISNTLRLQDRNTVYLLRSNDRPDIRLMARPLKYPAKSFKDLDFLIPRTCLETYDSSTSGMSPFPKFVVFFDNMKEAESAAKHLRGLLHDSLKKKIVWFHSVMTQEFREDNTDAFRMSDVWGLCATDAFGMGMDLPDIEIIVQWKATCTLCSMWQRFGRGARGEGVIATAILLFDKKDVHEEQEQSPMPPVRESGLTLKRKACEDLQSAPKRPALATKSLNKDKHTDSKSSSSVGSSSGDGGQVETSCTVDECRRQFERCDSTANVLKGVKARGKRPQIVVGGAMDSFINPPTVLNCRRMVVNVYFGNDKTCK
ncbi:P-loop containing nucleoside triphosphate hydrolase protein [Amanita rubescens]|nr:P-loop containing nucleoside triphosphate hydrolase protein [Amanita rubescens]